VISESNYEKLPGQISGGNSEFPGGNTPPGDMHRINTGPVTVAKQKQNHLPITL